jgi:hypothetical protein
LQRFKRICLLQRQTYRLPAVALQGCDLAEPFRFRLGFGLEKLPASIKRTKIEIPGMRLAVAIFKDSKGWSLHGRKYSQKRLGMSIQSQ